MSLIKLGLRRRFCRSTSNITTLPALSASWICVRVSYFNVYCPCTSGGLYCVRLSFFCLSVPKITHEPLHSARLNFAWTCIVTTARTLLNFKVIGQVLSFANEESFLKPLTSSGTSGAVLFTLDWYFSKMSLKSLSFWNSITNGLQMITKFLHWPTTLKLGFHLMQHTQRTQRTKESM